MELTTTLIKILPTLIVGGCDNLFDRSIEKLVMDKADFESIIEDRILFEELPDIDTRVIRSFLELDDVELIVKQIYVDNVDKPLEEIKEDFCLLFSHHFNVKTEPSCEFASNLFDVLVEGCRITFNKAISRGNIAALDAKTQYRFRQLSDDLGRIDRNTQDTADIMRQFKNAIPLLAGPEHPIKKISLAKLPSTSSALFGREKELESLNAAWANPKTNIVTLVAFGGMGKTALVNAWLNHMRDDDFGGAERVFGWSFYSQGASEDKQVSADVFIASALKWFGDPKPDEGSPWDKGERLADLIKKQKTLLILDGVEPLQNPPGEGGGRIKDPGLQSLLRELANHNPGLCVISTRIEVDDIKDFIGNSVQDIPIEHLSPDAGKELLAHLGVKGTSEELKQASRDFGCHALALTLLGNYLAVVYDGAVQKRNEIARLTDDEKNGGHAKRVMASYEEWFRGRPELDILRIMGLFDRPTEGNAIEVLRAKPPISGLTSDLQKLSDTKWRFALNNLRKAGLLANEDGEPDKLDCHPLIREHFGDKLKNNNPDAWKEGHSRLYEYYKKTKEFPGTIEEMAPLYQAVAHGCEAGRHQEAFEEVYFDRIRRGDEHFSTRKLGAIGSDLAALSSFFDSPWSQPVATLNEVYQAFIMHQAGHCLRMLGRLAEAAQPIQAGMDISILQENWINVSRATINLTQIYLTLDNVTIAFDCANKCVEYADRSGEAFERMVARTNLADVLHQAGLIPESEAAFVEAEEMQKEMQPEYSYLYSMQGFQYCDLLLSQGKYREVLIRANKFFEWRVPSDSLLDIALYHLSLGRAHLLQTWQEESNDFTQAVTYLNNAVDGLRQAGQIQELPRGLLAQAELHRVCLMFPEAQHDLGEAMSIAERGGMGLHKADCHLEYAQLHLAKGEKEDARKNLDIAKKMIEDMGYHRRDDEVREIEEKL